MTQKPTGQTRIGELVNLLGQLRDLYMDMQNILNGKLDAMRRADSDKLNELVGHERGLVERIRERDGLRKRLVAMVCGEIGLGHDVAATITLTELASRIKEPRRGHLMSLSQSLKEVVTKVGETNRVIATVSDVMLKHFGKVHEAMIMSSEDPGLYSAKGVSSRGGGQVMFSAVG
jgi:hypothetical protein